MKVIFLEISWWLGLKIQATCFLTYGIFNSCVTLCCSQAMDRAHRLGQRKVVNVHRLIMRGTLEEKVMSLQKFKLSVANAVINSENASMKTMNTDQLLDLFTSASVSGKVKHFLI